MGKLAGTREWKTHRALSIRVAMSRLSTQSYNLQEKCRSRPLYESDTWMRSQYRLQIMDYFLDSSGTYLPEAKTWRTPVPRKVEPSLSAHLVASAISPLYLCTWTFVNGKPWRIGLSGKAVRSA